jgi:hypothetical protein
MAAVARPDGRVTWARAGWEHRPMPTPAVAVLLAATATSSVAAPPSPPPATTTGPPPAWVAVAPASRPDLPGPGTAGVWLRTGSTCWAPPGGPAVCGDTPLWVSGVPRVVVRRGGRLTFHLGFQPTGVVLLRAGLRRVVRDGRVVTLQGRVYRLGAAPAVSWRVRVPGGRAILFASAPQGSVTHLLDVAVRR